MKEVKRIPIKKKHNATFHVAKPRKSNNNVITIVSIIVVVALLVGIYNKDSINSVLKGDEIVAKVNGNVIYLSDVEAEYAKVPPLYRPMFTKKLVLDQIISQEVLVQEARKLGLMISQSEMDDLINEAIAKSGKTRSEFIDILKAQNSSIDELKQFYELSLVIDKLITQEVINNINITDEEIESYYNENKDDFYDDSSRIRVSHILFSVDGKDKEEVHALAEEVRQRALNGEDFSELAVEFSDDPSVSVNSGDLGYFTKGMMVRSFEDAAFALPVGEISDVIESSFGYHIIYKVDEKGPGYLSLEDATQAIRKKLTEEAQRTSVEAYITSLRNQSKIEYFGEFTEDKKPTLEMQIGNQTVQFEVVTDEEVEEMQKNISEDSQDVEEIETEYEEISSDVEDVETMVDETTGEQEELEVMVNETVA